MNNSKVQVGLGKVPLKIQSSQNRLYIKGGKVVNDDRIFDADVYIEGGVIREIGHDLTIPGGVRTIEAKGKYIMPGGIDSHTHMQFKFMGTSSVDDFYSGTKAALAGGTTTIIDFVAPTRGDSLLEMYEKYREWADAKVCCDYGLHVIVPHFNAKVAEEMRALTEKGINSFKIFLAYPGVFMVEDDEAYDVFKLSKELGALVQVHCENGKLIQRKQVEIFEQGITGPEGHLYSRPESAELEATNRAITLADATSCPLLVVHVMSPDAAKAICDARRQGTIVWGEVLAAAIGTDGRHYTHTCWRHAAGHVMSPPLRPSSSDAPRRLMQGLASGDLECTGSDHCTFKAEQKALGKDDFRRIPNGINGVEERMMIVWEMGVNTGLIDPCKFVSLTSTNTAKLFNMYPRKGRIQVGSDADIVLWDPNQTKTITAATHHSNCDFNIFENQTCRGSPWMVISGGRIVLEDGEIKVTQGVGQFIPTPPFAPYVYTRQPALEKSRIVRGTQREPYTGKVVEIDAMVKNFADSAMLNTRQNAPLPIGESGDAIVSRGPTCGGGRHMQDSSFAFSGAQLHDDAPLRTSIRANQPPGGASSKLW